MDLYAVTEIKVKYHEFYKKIRDGVFSIASCMVSVHQKIKINLTLTDVDFYIRVDKFLFQQNIHLKLTQR